MKTNIALICVLNNYSKNVSKMLSDKLDMFYADMEDMIEYELIDSKHILETLGDKEGKKFIKKIETDVIKNVSSFENTFININPVLLFSGRNFSQLQKTCFVIYAQISPKYFDARTKHNGDVIPADITDITFGERDKKYVEKADVVVNCSTLRESKAVKKIMSELNSFLKNMH